MPKYTQPRKTWQYTNEFKVKAVELSHLEGVKVQDVAKTLDIHPFMLSRWRKEYREGKVVPDTRRKPAGSGKEMKELDRLKKLERENARLKQENDLLKSGNGIWRNNIRALWIHPKTRTADDVLPALRRVIARRRPPPGLIFHTDRGIEFMAYAIQDELEKHGLRKSYNRLGYCTDNAHMESFYHSLKGELVRGRKFSDESALRSALSWYIDGFYNRTRLHSGIEYTSPILYENRAA